MNQTMAPPVTMWGVAIWNASSSRFLILSRSLSLSPSTSLSLSAVTFRQSLSGGAIVLGPCHNPWPFYKYYVERLIIHWNLHCRKNTSKNTAKKSTTGTTRRPTKHVVALLCSNLHLPCLLFRLLKRPLPPLLLLDHPISMSLCLSLSSPLFVP